MGKIIYIIDVSGKVARYDDGLFQAMTSNKPSDVSIELKYPGQGLLDIIPTKYYASGHKIKRFVKVLEGLANYVYLLLLFFITKPLVIHFQWFPFLDFCSLEKYILRIIRFLTPKSKIVLTIHNVYPHNMNEFKKKKYHKRFCDICKYINGYIVHTETTKNKVSTEFNLPLDNIHICYHGTFVPNYIRHTDATNRNKVRILQFGGQSYYKGTDIFVDALSKLPNDYFERIEPRIVGNINSEFLNQLKSKDERKIIVWKPYFLEDNDLYNEIIESDIIVLPYRDISQSGVLMLSLFFCKALIVSNLPTFVETLRGDLGTDDPDFFFESGDPLSMCDLLIKHIDHKIDENSMKFRIQHLSSLYSWDNSAKMTYRVYNLVKQPVIR